MENMCSCVSMEESRFEKGEHSIRAPNGGDVGEAEKVTLVCCEDEYFTTRKAKASNKAWTFAARFGAGATWMHDAAEEEKYK